MGEKLMRGLLLPGLSWASRGPLLLWAWAVSGSVSHKKGRLEDLCVSPQRPSPDVKAELFELLFRTLHHNWRYFFKSSVLASVQRGIAEEQMENEPQFSAIMQVTWKSC